MNTEFKINDAVYAYLTKQYGLNKESSFPGNLEKAVQIFGKVIGIDNDDVITPYLVMPDVVNEENINNTSIVSEHQINQYSVSPLYKDQRFFWVPAGNIFSSKEAIAKICGPYGHSCLHCSEHYEYAESNTNDNRLLCYSCRSTEKWRYKNLFESNQ